MDKIIILAAAVLVVWAVWQTVQKFRGKAKNSCCGTPEAVTPKQVEDTDESHYPYHYRLKIGGMACSNCARRVENILDQMEGVWAKVDLGKGEAKVLSKKERGETDFRDVLGPTDYSLTAFQEA